MFSVSAKSSILICRSRLTESKGADDVVQRSADVKEKILDERREGGLGIVLASHQLLGSGCESISLSRGSSDGGSDGFDVSNE